MGYPAVVEAAAAAETCRWLRFEWIRGFMRARRHSGEAAGLVAFGDSDLPYAKNRLAGPQSRVSILRIVRCE